MTLLERCQAVGKLNKDLAGTPVVDVSSSLVGCYGQLAALEAEFPDETFETEQFDDGRCVVVWAGMPEDIWDKISEEGAARMVGDEPPEATPEQIAAAENAADDLAATQAAENESGESSEESKESVADSLPIL